MKGGYWVRRTIRCKNGMRYKSQYWDGPRKPRKDRRPGSSSIAKKDNNLQSQSRKLAMILNCNFGVKDYLLTLTYDALHLPDTADGAGKLCQLFMRRLTRALKAAGQSCRWVWSTCDKSMSSGHVGEPVRLHHHVVISGFDLEQLPPLQEIWGNGFVNLRRLEEQKDVAAGQVALDPVAVYITRQAVEGPNRQKWHSSRGMEKPVITKVESLIAPEPMKTPAGAIIMDSSEYNAETGSQFMAYYLPPRRRKERNSKGGPNDLRQGSSEDDQGRSEGQDLQRQGHI